MSGEATVASAAPGCGCNGYTASTGPPQQLLDIHDYLEQRQLTHLLDLLPSANAYTIKDVSKNTVCDNRHLCTRKRIQLGKDDQCVVWAFLRRKGYDGPNTNTVYYVETANFQGEIKADNLSDYPVMDPFHVFCTEGESPSRMRNALSALVKYLFLSLRLEDRVYPDIATSAHEHVAFSLRQLDAHEKMADTLANRFGHSPNPTGRNARRDSEEDRDYEPFKLCSSSVRSARFQNPGHAIHDSPIAAHASDGPTSAPAPEPDAQIPPVQIAERASEAPRQLEAIQNALASAQVNTRNRAQPGLGANIQDILAQIQEEEAGDEEVEKQLEEAKVALETRKKRRDETVDHLMEHRAHDLRDYLKKAKRLRRV